MSKQKLSELVAGRTDHKSKDAELDKAHVSIPAVDAVRGSNTAIQKTMKYKEIDPEKCRPWRHHNRPEVWLTPENCASLIESIREDGQLELGLVRAVNDEPGIDYEVIYGVRRWYSTTQVAGAKFKARITDENDQTCALMMHVENEESEDISEFEKALSYSELIEAKVFSSQSELADLLRVSRPYISKLMRAAGLFVYDELRSLLRPFSKELSTKKALEIVQYLDESKTREKLLRKALELGSEKGGNLPGILHELRAAVVTKSTQKVKSKEKCYFKHGTKKLLYSKTDSSGKFVLTMEPGFLAKAGDEAEDLIKEIFNDMSAVEGAS